MKPELPEGLTPEERAALLRAYSVFGVNPVDGADEFGRLGGKVRDWVRAPKGGVKGFEGGQFIPVVARIPKSDRPKKAKIRATERLLHPEWDRRAGKPGPPLREMMGKTRPWDFPEPASMDDIEMSADDDAEKIFSRFREDYSDILDQMPEEDAVKFADSVRATKRLEKFIESTIGDMDDFAKTQGLGRLPGGSFQYNGRPGSMKPRTPEQESNRLMENTSLGVRAFDDKVKAFTDRLEQAKFRDINPDFIQALRTYTRKQVAARSQENTAKAGIPRKDKRIDPRKPSG